MKIISNFSFLILIVFGLIACKKNTNEPRSELSKITNVLSSEGFITKLVGFSPIPSNSMADMSAMKSSLQDKQIFAFGEATHGTSEFHTAKHRIFQFLSTELGVKNLVIEENFSAVVPLNDFIKSGSGGDVKSVLSGLRSSLFKTQEFKNLVIWMQNYNLGKAEKEKLSIYGMDAQNTAYSAMAIQKYVQKYDANYLPTYNTLASSFLADLTDFSSQEAALKALPTLVGKIKEVRTYIEGKSNIYTSGAGIEGYSLLLQHITIIEQALNQYIGYTKSAEDGFETRDANMSNNVKWIEASQGANTKIMVWAHNGHVNLVPKAYFGGRAINFLGTNLRKMYGNKFYTVGFVFNEGEFSAVNQNGQIQNFTVKPYKTALLSLAMASLNTPAFFYDFTKHIGNSNLTNVFDNTYDFYNIGADYYGKEEDVVVSVNLTKEFDGIIFISKTTAFSPM